MLADLLHWHRREEKPEWWAYYHRVEYESDDDFTDDRECIGGLQPKKKVRDEKKSTVFRYKFDPQDHKFSVGSEPFDPATGRRPARSCGSTTPAASSTSSAAPKQSAGDHPRALIPGTPVPTKVLRNAIAAVAEWVADHGIDAPGPHRAIRDLLLRRPPERLEPGNGSYLAVQGPPGSGKTYQGARMIVDLVQQGKRVGITAHSHAVIGNMLREMSSVARRTRRRRCARCRRPTSTRRARRHRRCVERQRRGARSADVGDEVDVVAGTAWLWARPQMRNTVDVLFVDEAGQKSLADVVAVSGAAKSIVLLGDPQQLAQPSKGSHPAGAEVSALEHLLDGADTMPDDLGLFLETTHRMHPKVCAFISEIAYDGKLHSEPDLERQSVDGEAGLRWVPVEHEGNRTASPEEAKRVRELIDDLVGSKWTDKKGKTRKLKLDDILVVAPYNAHVACLQQHLPDRRAHRHRRQVPRPRGTGHHLLHGHQHRRRRPALDGVPLRPPPPQRRRLTREGAVDPRLQPRAAEGPVPHAEGTPPR